MTTRCRTYLQIPRVTAVGNQQDRVLVGILAALVEIADNLATIAGRESDDTPD